MFLKDHFDEMNEILIKLSEYEHGDEGIYLDIILLTSHLIAKEFCKFLSAGRKCIMLKEMRPTSMLQSLNTKHIGKMTKLEPLN